MIQYIYIILSLIILLGGYMSKENVKLTSLTKASG